MAQGAASDMRLIDVPEVSEHDADSEQVAVIDRTFRPAPHPSLNMSADEALRRITLKDVHLLSRRNRAYPEPSPRHSAMTASSREQSLIPGHQLVPRGPRMQPRGGRQGNKRNHAFSSQGHNGPRNRGPGRGGPLPSHTPRLPLVRPTFRSSEDWSCWVEVSIKVRGLPFDITTLELWTLFSQEGNVHTIELFENRLGKKDGTARVRFRPPPVKSFWQSGTFPFKFSASSNVINLSLALEENKRPYMIPSPVDETIQYPCRTMILADAIDFGFLYDQSTMMTMHTTRGTTRTPIVFELDLQRKHIDVAFVLHITDPRSEDGDGAGVTSGQTNVDAQIGAMDRHEKYMFRIPFEQMQLIREADTDNDRRTLVVSLETPPNFYRKAVGKQLEESHISETFWAEWNTWFRQTDIVYDQRDLRDASLTLKKTKPVIDIGRWTTYRFTLPSTMHRTEPYRKMCQALRDHNVHVEVSPNFAMIKDSEPPVWKWIDQSAPQKRHANEFLANFETDAVPPLSFPVRYQLEVCISQGILNEHNLSKAFVERLAALDERKATNILECVAQAKTRYFEPMDVFNVEINERVISRLSIPHYCVYSRKATVTPSTIYFSTPAVETSNRVVRQYLEHSDRFLRVSFTDEKFQGRINSSERDTNNAVFTRISRALVNGITIGERHFRFLAFGNSQFRDHGAYFFAPTSHLSTGDIRRWMGDFSSIRIPALYAARIGQCFSTTRAINGTRVQIVEMRDVIRHAKDASGRDDASVSFNFTDGVGKISESLAKLVAGELNLPFVPSVLQFRLGGCKGVLAVWPDAQMWQVHIRKSQYKFPAIHNGLEIIRWSMHAAASLNRQIIMVLSTLGVEDEIFVQKLKDMLVDLQRAMWDETKALYLLQRYVDPNHATITMAELIMDGFMKSQEPFLISLLRLWRAWSIKYLKERAKIIIEKGTFLLGCTDESRTLRGHFSDGGKEYDNLQQQVESLPEIFIQIPNPQNPGQYMVIERVCILARNPSLHPGDIRVVRAVNSEKLHHLRDVVVLPQTGERDVASMCSGGDLDGDDFMVIWDPDLIPKEWNHEPMDYTPPTPLRLDREVVDRDITSFFVNYMKNDRLPRIAHAHLALADGSHKGVKDERCLELAALHSKAVDYVKTGEAAQLPKELRPRQWPHFMEKRHVPREQTYVSRKVLGQLYDQVERVDFVPHYDAGFDGRILQAYELGDEVLESAREMKELYDADMRRIMAQHNIRTEFEVWSTFVIQHAGVSKDYKFHEEMGQISGSLKDRYRHACIQRAGGKENFRLGPFVAAIYTVTHREMAAAMTETQQTKLVAGKPVPVRNLNTRSMPLMSFPWCFPDVLGKIATKLPAELDEEKSMYRDAASRGRRKTAAAAPAPGADDVETAEGVTHRGEVLELFHHDLYSGHGGEDSSRSRETSSRRGGSSGKPAARELEVADATSRVSSGRGAVVRRTETLLDIQDEFAEPALFDGHLKARDGHHEMELAAQEDDDSDLMVFDEVVGSDQTSKLEAKGSLSCTDEEQVQEGEEGDDVEVEVEIEGMGGAAIDALEKLLG
ncbi:MAG: hypothetical protein M1825_003729 [Sarcosagium campestre]|nr:MAG: hypothetical protein M1825_003729 [Sarcosagium campestre]